MYGGQIGCFILAKIINTNEIAGGVGLRFLSENVCEMKRLFVYEKY